MRNGVITLIGLRSRSILQSTISIPRCASGVLSSFPEKIPSSSSSRSNAKQLARPRPAAFDISATFTHPDKAIMDVLSDFVAKNRGSSTYPYRLWKLLTSARLRDLGVGYNIIPIPDKQEWKASWYEEGKPNWLGNIAIHADDVLSRSLCTAISTGYVDKDGGKGGYGVIIFDHYGRPKVASVGVSLKGNNIVPLIYYEFQGVRSALKLAFDHGFGADLKLYCNSDVVRNVLDLCLDLTNHTPACMGKIAPWDGHKICTACAGIYLYGYRVMEDFDLLFPVVEEILDLFYKINHFTTVVVRICRGSGDLAKHVNSMETIEDEVNQFGVSVDDELGLYELVIKPEKIPEEVDDSIYDEVFKGDRVHSKFIMVEKSSKVNEYTHPSALYNKLSKLCTHETFAQKPLMHKKYKSLQESLLNKPCIAVR